MEKLERVRKAQLVQVKGELAAAESLTDREASVDEAADRLQLLQELAGNFRRTQASIEEELENPEAVASVHDVRGEFNTAYYKARKLLREYIAENQSSETGSETSGGTIVDNELREAMKILLNTQRTILENQQRAAAVGGSLDPVGEEQVSNLEPFLNVRLPPIHVPSFNGDRKSWSTFKDIFTTTIHNRADVKDSLKMQYLMSYLEGSAKQLVSSYTISDAHYLEAWTALTNHYDKKKYTVFALVREFVDQPSVVNANYRELRKLITTSDEVVRQMDALGDGYKTRDPWLIHLLLEKLDDESRSMWAQRIIDMENPNLDDLLKFLDSRCDALETCTAFAAKTTPGTVKKESVRKPASEKKVRSMHSLTEEKSVDLAATDSEPDDQPVINTMAAQISEKALRKVFVMPTAVIRIKSADGNLVEARALIDSGSEASLISETCANKLGLPRLEGKVVVSGMGQQAVATTRGIVELAIANRFNDMNVLKTKAYVMDKLTTALPSQHCMVHSSLRKKIRKFLADPAYQHPGPIDIILGADVFLPILTSGQVKDNDGIPVAQNTIFGWVVSGRQVINSPSIQNNFSITSFHAMVNKESIPARRRELDRSHAGIVQENVASGHNGSRPDGGGRVTY